jgi:membrane fusion protein, multidrug efflux system
MKLPPMRHKIRLATLVACVLLLADCRKQNAYQPPPPPEVGVAHPVSRMVRAYLTTTGSAAAINSVDLVARVEGFVQSIDYRDGAEVKAGTKLFTIEPPPFQAKFQQAQAALASAQAQLASADAEYRRQASLAGQNYASQSSLDQARATRAADDATVTSQQAALVLAGINLGYTNVAAPFDGTVTQHLVSVGDLVGVSSPTKLASIVQLAPIYVNFSLPEQDVQRVRADLAAAGLTVADLGKVTVDVGLSSEEGYSQHGTLDYAAPMVDTATGTLALRAVLTNANHVLLPGYFVRVRVPRTRAPAQALLVPDAALGSTQGGRYVLVLNKDNVVEQRAVRTGDLQGSLRIVEHGLAESDRVVVDGLARAIPGETVTPKSAAIADQ